MFIVIHEINSLVAGEENIRISVNKNNPISNYEIFVQSQQGNDNTV